MLQKSKMLPSESHSHVEGGDAVVVAVSAMGDTTDNLIRLAHEISVDPPERELDMLLSHR